MADCAQTISDKCCNLTPIKRKDFIITAAKIVKHVAKEEYLQAAIISAITARQKFLDIARVNEHSTASDLYQEISADPTKLSLSARSGRSEQTALNATKNIKTRRFQTIEVHLGENDTIKITTNTFGSKKLGSVYIYKLPAYGVKMLQIFYDILGRDPQSLLDRQKALFTKILECRKAGKSLMLDDLLLINPELKKLAANNINTRYRKLLALEYLYDKVEIHRRPNYCAETKTEIENFCCSELMFATKTMVERLLRDGYLTLADVFNADAPYNLAAGTQLMAKAKAYFEEKFARIEQLYMQTYHLTEVVAARKIGKKATLTNEGYHQLYVQATTDVLETPGKNYQTPAAMLAKSYREAINSPVRFSFAGVDDALPECYGTPFTSGSDAASSDDDSISVDLSTPTRTPSPTVGSPVAAPLILTPSKRARENPKLLENATNQTEQHDDVKCLAKKIHFK